MSTFPEVPENFALERFDGIRKDVLADAVSRTSREFPDSSLEGTLREALFQEKHRLRKFRMFSASGPFTYGRHVRDARLWSGVRGDLLKRPVEAGRREITERTLRHYAEEIGGHFDPAVYRFATSIVPIGFNWMLNAASFHTFLPWKMKENVQSRLKIEGRTEHLRKLADRGTILLVPTHQSNIDSILIGFVIYMLGLPPFAYGAGLNLFTNPVLSFFMRHLGAYTVDRQKSNALYKALLKHYSTRVLEEGVHSIFFPGGGRSRSGAIENNLKLGLLGTGLQAQIRNYQNGKPNPNVYVVPMVMSYHFVLEAGSLIEDFLQHSGGHRFLPSGETEPFFLLRAMQFFWRFFSTQSDIHVRIGQPLDIFGNHVDEEGRSLGPNGTSIDPKLWLTTQGVLREEPARDREYTKRLGEKISERFHKDHTVLASHVVAHAYFEALRRQYPEHDLFKLLRLSIEQRTMPYARFAEEVIRLHGVLRERADQGGLFLSTALQENEAEHWIRDGMLALGALHGHAVLKHEEETVWSEDLNLLYYYRNRLTGYGLRGGLGEYDEQGFLA